MTYVCQKCGKSLPGQSATKTCPACAPAATHTYSTVTIRCPNCSTDVQAPARAPEVECTQCGRMLQKPIEEPPTFAEPHKPETLATTPGEWRLDAALRGGESSADYEKARAAGEVRVIRVDGDAPTPELLARLNELVAVVRQNERARIVGKLRGIGGPGSLVTTPFAETAHALADLLEREGT